MALTLGGLFCSGLVYVLLSLLIRWRGMGIILRLLPPVVTGPVIVVIGLVLAPVAVNMALGKSGDGAQQLVPENTAMIISMASLAATVLVSLLGRGFLRLVPILCGIGVGFGTALWLGVGGWDKVLAAPWLALPAFTFPEFSLEPVLFIIPITLAPAIEHFGDIIAISSVTGRDYLKDPASKHHARRRPGDHGRLRRGRPAQYHLFRSHRRAVTLTRAFNPAVMTWAALCAILLSCISKLGAFLASIPTPVMGGIMILLFGAIMVVGLNTLVRAREDLMEARNMVIVALIIIFGVGGMQFSIGSFKLGGIGLAAVTGVLLNLFLPRRRE